MKFRIPFLLFATAALSLTCPSVSYSASDERSERPPVAASYDVPVRARLTPYAHFELEGVELSRIEPSGALHITFALPQDLVGPYSVGVDLTQIDSSVAGQLLMDGPLARATCVDSTESLVCHVKYNHKIHYGWPVFYRIFRRHFGHRGFIRQLQVALSFSGDPVGILTIRH